MKNKSNKEIVDAYTALMKRLGRVSIVPEKHVFDNKCSENLKELICNTYTLELVPPECHQGNIAEAAIKAFKQHFLSILAGFPDGFPWSLWDRFLPHTEITLNLLCQSNATPNVSAYAHMYGNFDYNRMSLAPIRCPCQCTLSLSIARARISIHRRGTTCSYLVKIIARITSSRKEIEQNSCQIQSSSNTQPLQQSDMQIESSMLYHSLSTK